MSTVSESTRLWHIEAAPSPSSMQSIRTDERKAIAFVNRGPNADFHARLISAAPELLAVVERLLLLADDEEAVDDTWKAAFEDSQTIITKWALG